MATRNFDERLPGGLQQLPFPDNSAPGSFVYLTGARYAAWRSLSTATMMCS